MVTKNWIFKRSAVTFTFDIETWFKVATHPFPKAYSVRSMSQIGRILYGRVKRPCVNKV